MLFLLLSPIVKGFHYSTFIHVHEVLWLYSSFFTLTPPSSSRPQMIPLLYTHIILFFRSRFRIWETTYDICFCQYDLHHFTWWLPVPSVFLQVTLFHVSLWLNMISLFHCVYNHVFFTHSSVDWHLRWFHNLVE
jgi:hypothetical protein